MYQGYGLKIVSKWLNINQKVNKIPEKYNFSTPYFLDVDMEDLMKSYLKDSGYFDGL